MNKPSESQFSGCLIGQCLGDALGYVVEGYPPEVCHPYVNNILKKDKASELTQNRFPFGQYSDDSQLARELMQSYVSCGKFDPQDYAKRISDIFAEERVVGQGLATQEAAQRLIRGVPWQKAGTPPPSAGNGSAMRAAPIGLVFFDEPEEMIKAAHDQGRITHQDSRCSAGAIVIAGAVALVLQENPFKPEKFLSQLSGWAYSFDPVLVEALKLMGRWVGLPPEAAVVHISKIGLPENHSNIWKHISPFVTTSVLWSLYSFLKSPDDYWETICTAIAVGGDVDTTAAMAGAISGARVGLGEIPAHLTTNLNDRGTWKHDELVGLATKVYEMQLRK